jgi:glyoxylase-like metal-dependent hydrolase (beta-lactamase superfamily II)
VELGSLQITSRETPGHADDGVTYVIDNFPGFAPKVAMVGDAIFAGSMGGAPSHYQLAREKVQSEILSLSAETILCPGHGPITTVAEQLTVNPFF